MRMIRPRLEAPQLTIAEDQEEFKPVTAALVCHPLYPGIPCVFGGTPAKVNSVVLAFRPSDEERAKIAAGADIYVNLLTFMRPMQGIILSAGPEEFAGWFGVEVEK